MDEELKEKYNSLLACATQLSACCSSLSLDGSTKLAKQCQSELKFLHSVRTAKNSCLLISDLYVYTLIGFNSTSVLF